MFEQGWAAEFFLDVCDFSKVKSFYDQMSGFDFCSFWKEGGETSTEKKYNGLLRHQKMSNPSFVIGLSMGFLQTSAEWTSGAGRLEAGAKSNHKCQTSYSAKVTAVLLEALSLH